MGVHVPGPHNDDRIPVQAYVDATLKAETKECAKAEGLTLSEYMRTALVSANRRSRARRAK